MGFQVLPTLPQPVLTHHPLGASTGYMSDLRGDWTAQIERATDVSSFAIELSALAEPELPGLADHLIASSLTRFQYVSIHGPAKGRAMPEQGLVESLLAISDRADAVVMHPDTMVDPVPYRLLGRKLVLENLDVRRQDGRTVPELQKWFEQLPEAGFCFDIAHAWSLDNSMLQGTALLDAFRTRLRHVHISSLSPDLRHVPLTEEHERLFMPLLHRCVDVPWILEAPPRNA